MHSVTDRQTDGRTDGQQDDANSRPYCVTVRSAKNQATPFKHALQAISLPYCLRSLAHSM